MNPWQQHVVTTVSLHKSSGLDAERTNHSVHTATPKAQANELFCKASLILFLSSFLLG